MVENRVTVVKFGVNNRGSNGTGCFKIEERTDCDEVHEYENIRIVKVMKSDGEGKLFVKNKNKAACRVSDIE